MNIVLSGNLRQYTDFEGEVELNVDSVGEALDALVIRFPNIKPVVFDGNGNLRSVHRLYLNGEVLESKDIKRELAPTDELGILTAVAGG